MEKFIRCCPECGIEILYRNQVSFNHAIKFNPKCKSCASLGQNNGMCGKFGDQNPMWGKHHTNETIEKIRKNTDKSFTKTESFKEKQRLANSGKKNGMYGKSLYDVWIKKYGKDVADEKMIKYKKKQSKNNSGEKNNMFGKPSPSGSGNGWSGWYKGWYFRSIKELTYMIKIIERFGFNWESGEKSEYKINYIDYKGSKRNYYPDFIIDEKYVVECKPKRLWNSDNVIRKKNAAIDFCLKRGLKYKLVDIDILNDEEIRYLYESDLIKFIDRYEKLYKEKIDGSN